ncbi:MAG: hypothetical protein ACRENF_05825 [Thermodesulfobacteriota bacterium]
MGEKRAINVRLGKKKVLMAVVLTLVFLGGSLLPAYARRSHHHHHHSVLRHHHHHGFYSRPYYYGYRPYSYFNTSNYDATRYPHPRNWYGTYTPGDQQADGAGLLVQAPFEVVKGVFSIFGSGQSSSVASKTVASAPDVKVATTSG